MNVYYIVIFLDVLVVSRLLVIFGVNRRYEILYNLGI